MDKILNKNNIYYNNSVMRGKWIYLKRTTRDKDIHYIFKIQNIKQPNPLIYTTYRQYYFSKPFIGECKCFCYKSNINEIEINNKDIMYELDADEWLDTFRVFVNNDNVKAQDAPDKLIQDK